MIIADINHITLARMPPETIADLEQILKLFAANHDDREILTFVYIQAWMQGTIDHAAGRHLRLG